MSKLSREVTYLLLALISEVYLCLTVAGRLISRLFDSDSIFLRLPLWSVLFVAPMTLFLCSKHYYLQKNRIYHTQPAATYPHRDPILGTDWIIDTMKAVKSHTILQVWDSLFQTVGSTYWAQNIGSWIIMTNEPENVKALLSSQFEAWEIRGTRQKVLTLAVGSRSIFAVNGEEWSEARAMMRPSFVRNQIADLECTDRHVENFIKRIPHNGEKVDLQDLFYLFTMDVSTDFMFGYSTNMLANPTAEAIEFTECFDYSLLSASYRARLGWIAFFVPDKKFERSVETCQRFIDKYVWEAQSSAHVKERLYVFMNEMLASGASREYVRDQLLAIILGGRDTSASTLSALFWTLARRPDIVRKLRLEISVLEGRKPAWEELKQMKYLNMVLKEALRLWAPVTTNMRSAVVDTVLPRGGGPDGQSPLFVPKGTACRWSLYSLHRRKDIFGYDAEEFRPERWEKLRPTWEYLPFSGGPRICIGQQFALTQMSYLVTRLLQTFSGMEPVDDGLMVQEVSTTTKLVGGCWVKMMSVRDGSQPVYVP